MPATKNPLLVNQCLENPSTDEVRAALDASAGGDGVAAPVAAAGAGEERLPEAGSAAASGRGRVLLLDDDPAFKEVMGDFLAENGYSVVAVQNGAEGIREVLAGDFALILCDMRMPSLPGDMFYRAVERNRPHLCGRFVFMTGYRGDAETNDFIESVSGFLLRKPFRLNDLLDWISVTAVCSSFQSVFESASTDPVPPQVCLPADPYLAGAALFRASPVAAEQPAPVPGAQADPAPRRPPVVLRAIAPQPRASVVSRTFVVAGLALVVALAVNLGVRSPRARDRAKAALAERLALEMEWRALSVNVEQAAQARSELASLAKRAERLTKERSTGGWTGALRAISTAVGAGIELPGVAARGAEGPPGACKVRIDGLAIGPTPRLLADSFNEALRREAERSAPSAVLTRIEMFENEPEPSSDPSDQRRARFTITLKVGLNEPAKRESAAAK